MTDEISLLPPAASSVAGHTDALFYSLAGFSTAIAAALALLAVAFCIRYRRGSRASRQGARRHANGLEWAWTIAPMTVFLGLFAWGAYDYARLTRPPADAVPVLAVAKQWVWTLQHADGRREINELHVPLGRPVRLLMTSQDVIHSFFVPAFRIKQDVLPGRYTSLWFTPTRAGTYHLLCAEYCGTDHAAMVGGIVVMPPERFAQWLQEGDRGPSLARLGMRLFRDSGCAGCHNPQSSVHAPDLRQLFGRRVFMQDGSQRVADETYLRDSIVEPRKDIVAGYEPIMPSYAGQLDEEQIGALVQYLRSGAAPEESP
ncbi:cytochrome c oxidase subunit II [Pigmentiphaga soli]|uniref:cytochrome-c oxidase n=1 Tax=Pigmentiphaga soli TaxID=1007095 RepID=A0ABP8H4Q9_9BURK